jgi:hypothetical protein
MTIYICQNLPNVEFLLYVNCTLIDLNFFQEIIITLFSLNFCMFLHSHDKTFLNKCQYYASVLHLQFITDHMFRMQI